MTYEKIFERVGDLYPNEYKEEDNERYKEWCKAVDAEVIRNVRQEPTEPRLMEEEGECLIPEPYSDIYIFYICAQIAYWQRDYDVYNAHMSMYNERMEDYNAWYIRTYGGRTYSFRGWI